MRLGYRIKFNKLMKRTEFKMDIFEKTRELGEMIQNSEEMKKAKAAEAAQAADEDAQTLLQEFNLKRMNLARDMQSGEISREDAIKQNNEEFEKIVEKNSSIKAYIEAKQQFDGVVNQINQILNFYITGQDPNCTHDCSSCGGCH